MKTDSSNAHTNWNIFFFFKIFLKTSLSLLRVFFFSYLSQYKSDRDLTLRQEKKIASKQSEFTLATIL
jgi:hypothetical protein